MADKVTASTIANLLAKGKVAEATAAAKELAAADAAANPATAEPAPPPAPRQPEEVVIDILKGLVNITGNHPALTPLMHELEEVTKKE